MLDYDEYKSTIFCENSIDDLINWLEYQGEPTNLALRDIDIQLLANNDKKRSIHQFDYVDSIPITVKMASNRSSVFSVPPLSKSNEPIQFDMERVASVIIESKEITAKLNAIYEQDNDSIIFTTINAPSDESHNDSLPTLTLDDAHLKFVRILATRSEWSRLELQEIVFKLEMMLDGALERINDAFLDCCDDQFIEGFDPIEINQDLSKEIFE